MENQASRYPFDQQGPSETRISESKLTVPTIKQSLTPFPLEQLDLKRNSADFSKSHFLEAQQRRGKASKPIQSAIFDSEILKRRAKGKTKSGEGKVPSHSKNISNLTNELGSMHTYNNSNFSQKRQMRFEKVYNSNSGNARAENRSPGDGEGFEKLNSFTSSHVNLKTQAILSTFLEPKREKAKRPPNPESARTPKAPKRGKVRGTPASGKGGREVVQSINLRSQDFASPKNTSTKAQRIRIKRNNPRWRTKTPKQTPSRASHLGKARHASKSPVFQRKAQGGREEKPAGKRPNDSKKKLCFTQPLFTNQELNEAYHEHVKQKDGGGAELQRPKKKKPSAKSSTPKSPHSRRRKAPERRGKSKPQPRHSKSRPRQPPRQTRPDAKKALLELKQVDAKVNTGLGTLQRRESQQERMRERRRVKKDFALTGVFLPEMDLACKAYFGKLEMGVEMVESLGIRAPKDVHLNLVLPKVEADQMDYVSGFEGMEHIALAALKILEQHKFGFDARKSGAETVRKKETPIVQANIFAFNLSQTFEEKPAKTEGKAETEEDKVRQIFCQPEQNVPHKARPSRPRGGRKSNIFTIDLDASGQDSAAESKAEENPFCSVTLSKGTHSIVLCPRPRTKRRF